MGNDTRAQMEKRKMPHNFAWYALRHSVDVANTLPFDSNPDACPLSVFTGSKPHAAHFRVWGCVAYAKHCSLYDRVTKMANQAVVRVVHLGRAPNQ